MVSLHERRSNVAVTKSKFLYFLYIFLYNIKILYRYIFFSSCTFSFCTCYCSSLSGCYSLTLLNCCHGYTQPSSGLWLTGGRSLFSSGSFIYFLPFNKNQTPTLTLRMSLNQSQSVFIFLIFPCSVGLDPL